MARLQFGKALKPASELIKTHEYLGTGLPDLDRLLSGGFIRGEISEIVGAVSAGKTSLAIAALGQATARGEVVAYIDTCGIADPASANQAGLDLTRLLWVRCDGSTEKALAAADILIRGGGFGMIVLDLTGPDDVQSQAKSHSHTWFRLKQSLEGTRMVFLVVNPSPVSGGLASLVLGLNRREGLWEKCGMRNAECGMGGLRISDFGIRNSGEKCAVGSAQYAVGQPVSRSAGQLARKPHTPARARAALFQGMVCEAKVFKGKSHGSATFRCSFHD